MNGIPHVEKAMSQLPGVFQHIVCQLALSDMIQQL